MKVDFQIIKRYLDGNGQEGDREKIVSWFSRQETEKDLHEQYRCYWNDMPETLRTEGYDEEKVLGKIYHEIKLEESKLSEKSERKRITRKIVTVLTRVAAILFIPLTILVLMNRGRFMYSEVYPAYSEIHAPKGTHTKFDLPDGSSGYLNGGSTVRFPTLFKGKNREVSLEGEAYFDVRSNPQRPFIVSGQNIKVVAYGTSFNVEVYPEDKINRVTLVKGKVQVKANESDRSQHLGTLLPGEMCVFDKEDSSSRIVSVDAEKIVSWKDGKLVFINEPFDEVVKKLNRRYGVNIVIEDKKLKDYTYLATFPEDETLDEVLKLLTISAPIKVTDLGREIGPDGSYGERTIKFRYKIK